MWVNNKAQALADEVSWREHRSKHCRRVMAWSFLQSHSWSLRGGKTRTDTGRSSAVSWAHQMSFCWLLYFTYAYSFHSLECWCRLLLLFEETKLCCSDWFQTFRLTRSSCLRAKCWNSRHVPIVFKELQQEQSGNWLNLTEQPQHGPPEESSKKFTLPCGIPEN